MKILHLVRNKVWGGGERYVLDLALGAQAAGHDVLVATRGIEEVDRRYKEAGLVTAIMPLGGLFDYKSPSQIAQWANTGEDGNAMVHVHTFKDVDLVRRARRMLLPGRSIKLVCTRHLVKPGGTGWIWRRRYAAINVLVMVSDLARRVFESTNPPLDPARTLLTVVHNGVDAPGPTKAPFSDGKVNILYCGRLHPEKGPEILLEAFAKLNRPDVTLSVAGTGDTAYVDALKEKASSLGIGDRVKWLGFVDDIYGCISGADICVAPTVAPESFGLSIVEYMSQGRPVVTTDNGAQPEIIAPGVDGILVKPGDPAALADALDKLLSDRERAKAMGTEARKTYLTRFTASSFTNQIMKLYRLES